MKTDISIPIPVFEAAESLAKEMGVSLSEFYTVAIHAYIIEHQKDNITETLNQVYTNEESALESQFVKMQVVSLDSKQW